MQAGLRKFSEPSLFAKGFLKSLPQTIARRARARWLEIANQPASDQWRYGGTRYDDCSDEANAYIVNLSKPFLKKWTMPLDSSATDEEICEEAKKLAEENRQFWNEVSAKVAYIKQITAGGNEIETALHINGLKWAKLKEMAEKSGQRGVSVADFLDDKERSIDAVVARLCDELFCRRRLRKAFNRVREEILRNELGEVSKRKGLYASDEAVMSRRKQRQRNAALLSVVRLVNELGQEFQLSELMEKSNANPAIRRAELMVRIAGFELMAKDLGHAGEFITLTCPSAYHAVHHRSGQKNEKFNGSTPRDAAAYLNRVWARIRSHLDDEEIRIYGFRVAEPHHDGTPHWHGLFFMPKNKVKRFREIVAMHGCRQDGKELGLKYFQTASARRARARQIQAMQKAWMIKAGRKPQTLAEIEKDLPLECEYWQGADASKFHKVSARVEFKAINWAIGSAAGYIAKYIAKNIDGRNNYGESVGDDYEAAGIESVVETSERVDAWASTWGIRQFQQIGGAPVTVWRELRRLEISDAEAEHESDLIRAALAADRGDWAKFVSVMGGIDCPRDMRPLALYKEDFGEANRYGEPRAEVVRGVIEKDTGFFKIGHLHEWSSIAKCGKAASWTCVNNCRNSENSEPKPLNGGALSIDPKLSEKWNILDWLFERRASGDFTVPDLGSITPAQMHQYRKEWLRMNEQVRQYREEWLRTMEQRSGKAFGDCVADMIDNAWAGAEKGRLKSEQQRAFAEYKQNLKKLAGRRPQGIVPAAEKLDLSDVKRRSRPSRAIAKPDYDTPEKAIGRLKAAQESMKQMIAEMQDDWDLI